MLHPNSVTAAPWLHLSCGLADTLFLLHIRSAAVVLEGEGLADLDTVQQEIYVTHLQACLFVVLTQLLCVPAVAAEALNWSYHLMLQQNAAVTWRHRHVSVASTFEVSLSGKTRVSLGAHLFHRTILQDSAELPLATALQSTPPLLIEVAGAGVVTSAWTAAVVEPVASQVVL